MDGWADEWTEMAKQYCALNAVAQIKNECLVCGEDCMLERTMTTVWIDVSNYSIVPAHPGLSE